MGMRLDYAFELSKVEVPRFSVEAVEGTDQCIRRAGSLCRAGEFTVGKVAKPQQDMRFDVPTIGPDTVRALAESGGRVLAVEADRTVILDEEEMIDLANRNKLIIVALDTQPPPGEKIPAGDAAQN